MKKVQRKAKRKASREPQPFWAEYRDRVVARDMALFYAAFDKRPRK